MPSLAQYRGTRSRPPAFTIEELNRAALPNLYAMRTRDLEARQIGIAEETLAQERREVDLEASQADRGILTQGIGTAVQGAGVVETAFPGTISGPLKSLAGKFGLSGVTGAVSPASTASGLNAATFTGGMGTGFADVAPIFGSSAASSPAAASGLSGSLAAAAPAGLGTPAVASTAPAAVSAAPAAGTGSLAAIGGFAAPVAGGAAAGYLGGKIAPSILPFGGKTGEKVESGIGGAAAGAATGALIGSAFPVVGTAIGAVLGGVSGGLTGSLSVIATSIYGIDAPETLLAQLYRRQYIGQIAFRGYRILGDQIAEALDASPQLTPYVKTLLTEPILRGMLAELVGLPVECYTAERFLLHGWLGWCRAVGREAWVERRRLQAA